MEPQEKVYYYDNKEDKCKKDKRCLGVVAIILLVAFTFVIGLIIGAALFIAILGALASVIVLAIILGLLLILTIILIFCKRCKEKKCECKCC